MEKKLLETHGHNKACAYCGIFFTSLRSDALYCCSTCRSKAYRRRKDYKQFLERLLGFFGVRFEEPEKEVVKPEKKKRDYARLTFLLSFIGFIGSVSFYLGVLRSVYNPSEEKQKIEQLEVENRDLKQSMNGLIERLTADEEKDSTYQY